MPIYAFECADCGHRFDRLQKLSDADPTDCPACGQPQVRRQLTAPSFRLAGAGWYETDFKKDGDKKRNLAEGSAAKPESKSEAKPEPAAKPAETKPSPST
jgi:putative FmdB family regulatory protein